MKRLALILMILLTIGLVGCSQSSTGTGYKITQGESVYIAKNNPIGRLEITEWWTPEYASTFTKQIIGYEHHTGSLVISGTYSIETITLPQGIK